MFRRFSALSQASFILHGIKHSQTQFQTADTPASAEVRSQVLGYRSGKLSASTLKAYCLAHGLSADGLQKDVLERVQKHILVETVRHSVFTLGWDPEDPRTLTLVHGANRAHTDVDPLSKSSVKAMTSWVASQCQSIGANVAPVVLPMYSDPVVDAFRQATGMRILQDAMGMCTSVFFEHVGRVQGMKTPRDLQEVYSYVCSKPYSTEHLPAVGRRNAFLCWDASCGALKHLGSKTAPEEQMLSSVQVSIDVFLVRFGIVKHAVTGASVVGVNLFCVSTKKTFKAEEKSLSDATKAVVQHLCESGKRNVVIVPCFKTRLLDVQNFARTNTNKNLRIHAMVPNDLIPNLQLTAEDPKECWKQFVQKAGGEEGLALKSCLDASMKRIKGFTMIVPTPKMSSPAQVEKCAADYKSIGAKKVQFAAENEFNAYMAVLMSPDRRARELLVAERHRRYLVIDLETTTQKLHKRVASPFCPTNRVVLPGYLDYRGTLTIPDRKLGSREEMRLPPLDDYDVLVGHNIKFDLLYLWRDPELERFLLRGGRVWDTLYSEYLLSGQRVRVGTGAGLSDVAVRYGGTRKIDGVKALWDQGICTKDIDHGMLAEYLEGDLRNTELVFRKQMERAVEGHQAMIIEARSDVILCTTEMEFNGLAMDRVDGKRQYEEMRMKIAKAKVDIQKLIPSEVSPSCRQHFNWNSNPLLAAVYFGGTASVAPDSALGMPLNTTAAVELAVRVGNVAGVRRVYASPYLKAQGLRVTGKTDEIEERVSTFVKTKTTFNYKLVLGGTSENGCWFYNPLTGKTITSKSLKTGKESLDAAMDIGENERAVIMMHTFTHFEIMSMLGEIGIELPETKWFYCTSGMMFDADDAVLAGGIADAMWDEIAHRIGGKSESEVIEKIFKAVGKSVGTKRDCFMTPVPEGATANVTFPGRVLTYFPDPNERAIFIQKSMTEKQKMAVTVEVLEAFAKKGEPIANALLSLRGDQKLLGTYFAMDGTGMMSLVNDQDSCIHHELACSSTVTSRMASANPNMQNVPKMEELRKLFVSRFGADGVLVEADYSQLEVIVMCALARDPQMTEDLRANIDFHCKRVTLMRPGVTYEEVVKKAKHEKDPEFVALRQRAKIFSFQRQYGAGVSKLAESTGMSQDEVRTLIKNEDKTYWRVKQFYDMVNYAVMTWKPELQDATRTASGEFAYKGEFRVPTGTRFTFGEVERSPEMMLMRQTESPMSFLSTQLKNYPVQGFAGEIVQVMLGRLYRHFVSNNNYGGKAYLTNTVHDCVWVDCHRDVYKQVATDVQRILSEVKPVFNSMFPELALDVSFGTETVVGKTMAHMVAINKFKE